MRPSPALLAAALVATFAAGCAAPEHGHTLDAESFSLELDGVPSRVLAPGESFDATVRSTAADGDLHATSDHVGAHFWNATVADPTDELPSARSCTHQGGELPGESGTRCTAPIEPGTYHVRAHARVTLEDGSQVHWWGEGRTFSVAAPE